MENKWLIRTTQNKILGPYPKLEILEFLQKESLNANDELTSGNGYWFYRKENELVEKYLYGDIPQGYNPISEAKSVLARRENPDKTSSINTSPANRTEVFKLEIGGAGLLPPVEDLEYPDLLLLQNSSTDSTAMINLPPIVAPIEKKIVPAKENIIIQEGEEGIYPKDDDLDYPDMKEIDSPLQSKNNDRDYVIEIAAPQSNAYNKSEKMEFEDKKQLSNDFNNEFEHDSGLTLIYCPLSRKNVEKSEREMKDENTQIIKKEKSKNTAKHTTSKEATRDALKLVKDAPLPPKIDHFQRTMPEHLKKRNDNYLMYIFVILVLIVLSLFFYYYRAILNK